VSARIAARFAALCLDAKGHLPDSDYADMGLRGALLVDLARVGRLTQTEESIDLDATPLGEPLADRALRELDALDGRSLDWWLGHGLVDLRDTATALVADGSWQQLPRQALHRDPRFAARRPEVREHDAVVLAGHVPPGSAEDAAVAALAAAAGLAGARASGPPDELVAATGSAAWVCRLVTDFVGEARIEGTAVSRASLTALWSGMPT
jgi:Golgi phosphoprotein 3 (GPP34)